MQNVWPHDQRGSTVNSGHQFTWILMIIFSYNSLFTRHEHNEFVFILYLYQLMNYLCHIFYKTSYAITWPYNGMTLSVINAIVIKLFILFDACVFNGCHPPLILELYHKYWHKDSKKTHIVLIIVKSIPKGVSKSQMLPCFFAWYETLINLCIPFTKRTILYFIS